MRKDTRQSSPLESFISSADTVVQVFSIGSVAIIIGLFVNFVFDISTLFPNSSDPCWTLENIYILLNVVNIIIFSIIIRKYIFFTSAWLRMQEGFRNKNSSERDVLLLLNKSAELITNHYFDFSRYILLFVFLFIMINKKVPLVMSTNNIAPEPHLFIFGSLLYISIIVVIEWPTINLYRMYKEHIRSDIQPQENMPDSL